MRPLVAALALFTLIGPSAVFGHAVKSTAHDRVSLEVTVYNAGFAMVTETRDVEIKVGEHPLIIEGVPKTIQPNSLMISGEGFTVVSRSARFSPLTPNKLLKLHEGKEATLLLDDGDDTTVHKRVRAKLLAATQPRGVWLIGEKVVASPSYVTVEYDELPEGLSAKPVLEWILNCSEPVKSITFSYLADGLGWSADYLLSIEGKDEGAFEGWFDIRNDTDAHFEDARVALVSGLVNRATPPVAATMGRKVMAYAEMDTAQKSGVPTADRWLFELAGPVSLAPEQSKQLPFLDNRKVSTATVYGYDFYVQRRPDMVEIKGSTENPQIELTLINEKPSGLGVRLPAGELRVYTEDSGRRVFAGSDEVRQTPVGEPMEIKLGTASDILILRQRTDYREFSNRGFASGYSIDIKNGTDETAVVRLKARSSEGEIKPAAENVKATSSNPFESEYELRVPSEGKEKLRASFTVLPR